MTTKIILSGMRPSGSLHIGNYLGALKQWVELQKHYRVFAMIADLHAITTPFGPKELHENTLKAAMFYIACGLDPKKSVIFVQSHVPAHLELAWILNTMTPVGELERMTQFKEKQKETGIMAGILNYPVLQAADVLIYMPDIVPIGEDQVQHLELTRTMARKFNNRFGRTFREPKVLVIKEAARIMSLDDPSKKMSKSASSPNSYIALLDTPEEIRRKIKTAVTDSGKEIRYDPRRKLAISNLVSIYSAFSGLSYVEIEKKYHGKGYAGFKKDLAELLINKLTPIQRKYNMLSRNDTAVYTVLKHGAKQASAVANRTLFEVKRKVGFVL